MKAFHSSLELKQKMQEQLQKHFDADEIVKGHYWENGKGCAVGCTIYGNDHSKYETILGIPITLAKLEDQIFEGLSNKEAKIFPLEFINAIKPGADLSIIWKKFIIWLLVDENDGVIKFVKDERIKKTIRDVVEIYSNGIIDLKEIKTRQAADAYAAAYAADAYAYAADAAAYAAAYADADAYADAAAAYAAAYADADAYAAAYAADAYAADAYAAAYAADAYAYADAAAYAAAYAADAYAAAYAAAYADADAYAYAADAADAHIRNLARIKSYSKQKIKLLELLKEAE